MELKELYDRFQTLNELAKMDPNLIEQRVRAGFEGKIRNAQTEVHKVESDYKKKVVEDCVIIAVGGKFGDQFADISKEFNTLPVDFLKTVDMMGDSILKRGGKDSYSTNEHFMAMDELNKIKQNYKIDRLPVFQAHFDGVGPNTTIKEALFIQISKQYGGQLYSAVTRGEIGMGALDMGFDGKVLPVVLHSYMVDLDQSMLPKPIIKMSIDKKPTVESVKKVLMEARSQFSSK